MSFWNNTGTQTGEYNDTIPPIPEGTSVLAAMDECKWDERDGLRYVSTRWTVMKPETYLNRKIFQKFWITDHDPNSKDPMDRNKKDNAKFSAIDFNAGGHLTKAGREPTDEDFQMHLMNKPMVLKLGAYSFTGSDGKLVEGNTIRAISSKSSAVSETPPTPATPTPQPTVGGTQEMDDEIPF